MSDCINNEKIKLGSIIIWEGNGILYEVLSRLIQWIDSPEWDRWGWHTSFISKRDEDDNWCDCSADGSGINEKPIADREGRYKVFNIPLPLLGTETVREFVQIHKGRKYHSLGYLWKALYILTRGHFPRILTRKQVCWDLVFEFCDDMGTEITDEEVPPYIINLLSYVGEL